MYTLIFKTALSQQKNFELQYFKEIFPNIVLICNEPLDKLWAHKSPPSDLEIEPRFCRSKASIFTIQQSRKQQREEDKYVEYMTLLLEAKRKDIDLTLRQFITCIISCRNNFPILTFILNKNQ